jgi:hypothetical protein
METNQEGVSMEEENKLTIQMLYQEIGEGKYLNTIISRACRQL